MEPRYYGETTVISPDREITNMERLRNDAEALLARARVLAARAARAGDVAFGSMPQGAEGASQPSVPNIQGLLNDLGTALSDIESGLNRL